MAIVLVSGETGGSSGVSTSRDASILILDGKYYTYMILVES